MNKRNWISALLAVMMVISMMTCIAMPVAAEEDYALTQEEAEALPSVQQAKMDDGIQSYKISSWEDLIFAAASARYETTAEYQAANSSNTDYAPYCYISAAVSGQYSADNYGNPSFIDQSRFVRGDISTYDRLYLTVDLDVKDYSGPGGTGAEGFKADYDAFVAVDLAGILGGNATRYQNSTLYAMIDGMGHTITGYEKDRAFIGGQFVGLLRNLTLDGATVDYTGSGLTYTALLVKGVNCGGATLENVHIKNSTFTTDQQGTGAIFVGLNSNNNRPVAFRNCSLINSHLINTYEGAINYGGLFVGLMASPASGYPSALNTMENCFVSGSSITCHSIGSAGGLLFGWVDKSSGTLGLKFDNVAVFDSEIICTSALGNGATYASVIAAVRRVSATAANDVGNVYAGNVTITSPDTEDTTKTVTTAVPSFFFDYGGNSPTFALQAGVTDGNYVSDGTITNAVLHRSTTENTFAGTTASEGTDYNIVAAIEDMNASAVYGDWGYATDGTIVYLEEGEKAPAKVTFTADGATSTYYTDVNGNLRVVDYVDGEPVLISEAELAVLAASDWQAANGEAVNVGADWSALVFDADTAYTKVTLPPYTVTLDKDTYSKGDTVTATVSLIAGSNLSGIEVGLNYDANVLTPVADADGKYAIAADGWLVSDNNDATDGYIAATAAAISGENFTEAVDVFSMKFQVTKDITSTAAAAELTAVLEYAGGLVGDEMTELDLNAYTTTEIMASAEIDNPEIQDPAYDDLTPASEAYWGDGITEYKIDSVGELIKMNMAYVQHRNTANIYSGDGDYTNGNFEPDDVIYLTADLDMSNWDYEAFATYEEGVGYTPEKIWTAVSAVYSYVDNTTPNVYETQEALFSAMYTGMVLQNNSARGYASNRFTFDGLGHTIYNYTAHCPFFAGNYVGIIENVTFENANVTNMCTDGTYNSQGSILVGGSTYIVYTGQAETATTGWTKNAYSLTIDNVHINNSTLNVTVGDTAGLFLQLNNEQSNREKPVNIVNCSAYNSKIVGGTQTSITGFGLVAGRCSADTDIDNVVLSECSIQTAGSNYHSLMMGSGADSTKNWNISNVAIVNCKMIAPTATADNVGILAGFLKNTHTNNFSNFYVSGNTVATSSGVDGVPVTALCVLPNATSDYTGTMTVSNIVADANVVNAIAWTADSTKNTAVTSNTLEAGLTAAVTELEKTITEAHWRVNADDTLYLLGQEVTFTENGVDTVRYTSRLDEHVLYEETADGFVAVDPAFFADIATELWYDAEIAEPTYEDFIQKGYDWASETYSKDKTFIRVPYASEATRYDDLSAYVIDDVAELIKTNMVLTTRGYALDGGNGTSNGAKETLSGDTRYVVWNFETSDTIYFTEDLDMTDWDTTEVASYDATTGEYTPYYLPYTYNANTSGVKDTRGSVSYELNNGTIDFDNDGTVDTVHTYTTKQDLFSALYSGFVGGYSAGLGYVVLQVNVDGLNHTIKNYKDGQPFFMAVNGTISNLTFDTSTVTNELWTASTYTQAAIVVGTTHNKASTSGVMDGVVIDNVHVKNATLTVNGSASAGLFLGGVGNSGNRDFALKNSSAVDSKIIDNRTQGNAVMAGLAVGYIRYNLTLENCLFENCDIENTVGVHHNTGLVVGTNHSYTAYLNATYNNIAVVDCGYKGPNASSANIALIHAAIDYVDDRGVIIHDIFASGNTVTPVTDGVDGEAVAITDVLAFYNTSNDYNEAHDYSNIVTDATVTYFMNDYLTDANDVPVTDNTLEAGIAAAIAAMNAAGGAAEWYLVDGNYVPAYAQVNDTYHRYLAGHTDVAELINGAVSSDKVRVLGDQAASTVAIPAGVTVELHGSVLDAIVGGNGFVNDDTDGEGGITALGTISASNTQLPLNDDANGVYRFFNFELKPGTDAAITGYEETARKFRLKLNFTNNEAYSLISAGTSGLTLTANLASEAMDSAVDYTFQNVKSYVDAIIANPDKSYSLVLNVYGVNAIAGSDLNVTYNVTANSVAKTAAATTYSVPAASTEA